MTAESGAAASFSFIRLHAVFECHIFDDHGQLTVVHESPPDLAGGGDQLRNHGQDCSVRQTVLGVHGAVVDVGEYVVNGDGRPDTLPLLDRETLEDQ